MPKFLVELDGKKFQLEGDHAPSEEEARQAIGEYSSQGDSSASPAQLDTTQYEDKPSPLNAGQNLMLGFMAEDVKPIYLQKEFAGRNVEVGNDGGITVDGAPVNPKGFDTGDILRSIGYTLPFGGQVAGSIAGGTAGTGVAPGVGTVAGGFAGGVAGATAGEGARLATGKFLLSALGKNLGLNNEGQIFIDSLSDTAKSAAIGETLGLGIAGAGTVAGKGVNALSKTQLYKGASDAWSKTIDKLKLTKSPVEDILQFVGKIDKNATRVVMREKPSTVLNEKYFDPNKTSRIASNTLFGTENFESLGMVNSNGVSKGAVDLLKSIKNVDDPSYDYLLQYIGINKEFIDNVRNADIENIIKPINTNNERRGFELSGKIIKEVLDEERRLGGEELAKAEIKAIRSKGNDYFNATPISNKIDEIVGRGSLLKATKVPNYQMKPAIDIDGAKKLRELSNILKGNKQTVTPEGVTITAKKPVAFDKVPPKQIYNIKKQFDAKVDEIFRNDRIPAEIRGQVKDIAQEFRSKYYEYLGINNEISAYSQFKNLTDGIKLEGRNAVIAMENKISNFSSITGAEQDELIKALSSTPNGANILKEISEFNLSKQVKKINPEQMIKALSRPLSSKRFLDSNLTNTTEEGILRKISNSIDERFSSRRFTNEAERSLAAKAFLGSNQDLLRIATLSGMLGLGGFKAFGPVGGLMGAGVSLAVANPQNLGRMLISAEKNIPIIKQASVKFNKSLKIDKKKQAVLSALIASKERQEKQKQKR